MEQELRIEAEDGVVLFETTGFPRDASMRMPPGVARAISAALLDAALKAECQREVRGEVIAKEIDT